MLVIRHLFQPCLFSLRRLAIGVPQHITYSL